MSIGYRCNFCQGWLAHSFITFNGIDVYRCGGENSSNEAGRYFIITASGLIEVLPQRHGRHDWSYDIVDTERRRLQEETEYINRELDERSKLYRNNVAEYERRQSADRNARRLAGEEEEEEN
jgi:hypothetical protein